MENTITSKVSEEPFGGFGYGARYFSVCGKDLFIAHSWRRDDVDRPKDDGTISRRIHGQAVSEKDTVCIIGEKKEVAEFSLSITSDDNASTEWKKINETETLCRSIATNDADPSSTHELRIVRNITERLDKNPPTAELYLSPSDWELGLKKGWVLACKLPNAVLNLLEEGIIAKRIDDIQIRIEWELGLARDKDAPPSIPTTWGLLKIPEENQPIPMRGHVTSVSWRFPANSNSENAAATVVSDAPIAVPNAVNSKNARREHNVSEVVDKFSRTATKAFVMAVILILISHFLR